jgi:transcriptional regulator with XRE-family HTH domain
MDKVDFQLDHASLNFLNHEDQSIPQKAKTKSPYQMRYSAEVAILKRSYGDLEQIRQQLGLSRRKICQYLLVDPSAWTRWEKSEAPPHIYKTLGLMMQLKDEKGGYIDPGLKEQVKRLEVQLGQLQTVPTVRRSIWPTISVVLSLIALGLSLFLGYYATSVILANGGQ